MSENSAKPEPTGMEKVETLEELLAFPDGTVVVWHDGYDQDRQAGVLVTEDWGSRERVIQPVSIMIYERNYEVRLHVEFPVWVMTFPELPEQG